MAATKQAPGGQHQHYLTTAWPDYDHEPATPLAAHGYPDTVVSPATPSTLAYTRASSV